MRTMIAGLVLSAALGLGASRADAQYVISRGYSYGSAPVGVSLPYTTTPYVSGPIVTNSYVGGPAVIPSVAGYGRINVATVGGAYIPPYNYTVVPNPWPARYYQGFGTNDFPYYGQSYGRPYDAWTWPYLSGGYYNTMARYFYPPL